MGIGRTFQNLLLWRHMNVLDHIRLAHYSQLSYGLFGAFFATPACRRQEKKVKDHCYRLMETFDISQFAEHMVAACPTEPNAGWRWPGPWPPTQKSFSWMNLLRV